MSNHLWQGIAPQTNQIHHKFYPNWPPAKAATPQLSSQFDDCATKRVQPRSTITTEISMGRASGSSSLTHLNLFASFSIGDRNSSSLQGRFTRRQAFQWPRAWDSPVNIQTSISTNMQGLRDAIQVSPFPKKAPRKMLHTIVETMWTEAIQNKGGFTWGKKGANLQNKSGSRQLARKEGIQFNCKPI